MKRTVVSAFVIAMIACGESTGPASPAALSIVSGDGQEAVVGTALSDPLVVRVGFF